MTYDEQLLEMGLISLDSYKDMVKSHEKAMADLTKTKAEIGKRVGNRYTKLRSAVAEFGKDYNVVKLMDVVKALDEEALTQHNT
jgi:hypothetical protein